MTHGTKIVSGITHTLTRTLTHTHTQSRTRTNTHKHTHKNDSWNKDGVRSNTFSIKIIYIHIYTKLAGKMAKMNFCYGSLRGQAQVRPIDKLDEAYTNADDRMCNTAVPIAS